MKYKVGQLIVTKRLTFFNGYRLNSPVDVVTQMRVGRSAGSIYSCFIGEIFKIVSFTERIDKFSDSVQVYSYAHDIYCDLNIRFLDCDFKPFPISYSKIWRAL